MPSGVRVTSPWIRDANQEGLDIAKSTPLHLAALEGHVGIIQLLLKLGCNKEAQNTVSSIDAPACCAGYAALMWPPISMIPWLVQFGKTPLHVAAERNKLDCLRLLLDEGCNPGARDDKGHTVLDVARAQKHEVCACVCTFVCTARDFSYECGGTPAVMSCDQMPLIL